MKLSTSILITSLLLFLNTFLFANTNYHSNYYNTLTSSEKKLISLTLKEQYLAKLQQEQSNKKDLSGYESKTNAQSTSSLSSNLNAKDILLATSITEELGLTATTISGSNLKASNDIYIQTGDLKVFSSADTYIVKQDSKDISGDS